MTQSTFQEEFETVVRPDEESCFGVRVQLQRGSVVSPEFLAVIEFHDDRVIGDEDKFTVTRFRQYIFAKRYAKLNNVLIEPREGDQIVDLSSGLLFEIVPPSDRRGVISEPAEFRWRVYTQQVG